jgi:23S rRNA (uracil1939-C5)-methyltransferase
VLVGFRERDHRFIADVRHCEVLDERCAEWMTPIAEAIDELSIQRAVPQVEVSAGDDQIVLVLRVLTEPSDADLERLGRLADALGASVLLQRGGLDSVQPLPGRPMTPLSYALSDHRVRFELEATGFVQVNARVNALLVDRVLELLDPRPDHVALDYFCGIGNFTLPLARRVARVVGVEGDERLVQGARANARACALENVEFRQADLYGNDTGTPDGPADRVLLDPPRTGAEALVRRLAERRDVPRLVYVSCAPKTLARDLAVLVAAGYDLDAVGIVDMFPHTGHVESVALLTRDHP